MSEVITESGDPRDRITNQLPLPPYIEDAIREYEKELTKELRESLGRDDLVVEFDRSPILLSPEKPERRWPDDFRGFGTNVRPKKQK